MYLCTTPRCVALEERSLTRIGVSDKETLKEMTGNKKCNTKFGK